MKALDLFAGAGGFSLGLHMAGIEDELMPVGLDTHVPGSTQERGALYNRDDPDTISALRQAGAVVLVAHTESRDPARLEAIGFEVKPEGLCRGDVCVPTGATGGNTTWSDDGIDLEAFAQLLGLPLALAAEERTACLGRSAPEHAGVLASGEAPLRCTASGSSEWRTASNTGLDTLCSLEHRVAKVKEWQVSGRFRTSTPNY